MIYFQKKKGDKAGQTYCQAADCHMKAKYAHEAASCFINAAHCYRKTNIDQAKDCIARAIDYYTEEGRFSMAAKYQKEIAEMYEEENQTEKAMEAYETAAEYYEGEGAVSSANQCILKVAHFAALAENYAKAIDIFDKVAKNALGNKLLKYGVKEYFLKATICHLALGVRISSFFFLILSFLSPLLCLLLSFLSSFRSISYFSLSLHRCIHGHTYSSLSTFLFPSSISLSLPLPSFPPFPLPSPCLCPLLSLSLPFPFLFHIPSLFPSALINALFLFYSSTIPRIASSLSSPPFPNTLIFK